MSLQVRSSGILRRSLALVATAAALLLTVLIAPQATAGPPPANGPGGAYLDMGPRMLAGTSTTVAGQPARQLVYGELKVGALPGHPEAHRVLVTYALSGPVTGWAFDTFHIDIPANAPSNTLIRVPASSYLPKAQEVGGPWRVSYSIQYFDLNGNPLSEELVIDSAARNYHCSTRAFPCSVSTSGLIF